MLAQGPSREAPALQCLRRPLPRQKVTGRVPPRAERRPSAAAATGQEDSCAPQAAEEEGGLAPGGGLLRETSPRATGVLLAAVQGKEGARLAPQSQLPPEERENGLQTDGTEPLLPGLLSSFPTKPPSQTFAKPLKTSPVLVAICIFGSNKFPLLSCAFPPYLLPLTTRYQDGNEDSDDGTASRSLQKPKNLSLSTGRKQVKHRF